MSSTPMTFRILNPIMKSILKSPFHKMMSGQIMIITFQGAKSGKEYATPVSYSMENETVHCFTHATWWKNFTSKPEVKLRIQGQDFEGSAKAIKGDQERIAAGLEKQLKAVPFDANFYNVSMDEDGQPNKDDVKAAAAECVMVQISL